MQYVASGLASPQENLGLPHAQSSIQSSWGRLWSITKGLTKDPGSITRLLTPLE